MPQRSLVSLPAAAPGLASLAPSGRAVSGTWVSGTWVSGTWGRALTGGLAAIAVVVLAACGKQAPPPEPDRYVRTLVLTPQSAGLQREFAAEVRARVESRLSFRVAGKILERRVDLGSVVKPGQTLARIDSSDLVLAQEALGDRAACARAKERYLSRYPEGVHAQHVALRCGGGI